MSEIQPGTPEWDHAVQYIRQLDARSCWEVGDKALEIVPDGDDYRIQRDYRRAVFDNLRKFAAETDISYDKLNRYRTVSIAWPGDKRVSSCSHRVHLMLATREDRYSLIRPGMTTEEAQELVKDRPRDNDQSVLSQVTDLIEARRLIRRARNTVPSGGLSDEARKTVAAQAAETHKALDELMAVVTGQSLDEFLEEIQDA